MTGAADESAHRHISFAKWGGPVVDGGLVYTIRWFTNADFCGFGAPAPEARNISVAYGFRESSASRFPLDQETRQGRDPKVDRLHRPRKSMALTARRRRNAKTAAKSSLWAGLRPIPKPASKISPGLIPRLGDGRDRGAQEVDFRAVQKARSRDDRTEKNGHGSFGTVAETKVRSMPWFSYDPGRSGLAIEQHHLNLTVLTFGKEDIAADNEVVRNVLRL